MLRHGVKGTEDETVSRPPPFFIPYPRQTRMRWRSVSKDKEAN
jgi:hypothetical protein